MRNQVWSHCFWIRKSSAFAVLISVVCCTYGQTKSAARSISLNERVQQQANLMGQAFLKADYQTFARYTYPALLSAMGGENRMVATLTQTVSDMGAKGMTFSSIIVNSPTKIVKSGNELQCTLQQHTTIKLTNGRAVATSTLIAISKDGGKDWLFVDTSNKDAAAMRKALSNLSAAIVIPPQQKPLFYSF